MCSRKFEDGQHMHSLADGQHMHLQADGQHMHSLADGQHMHSLADEGRVGDRGHSDSNGRWLFKQRGQHSSIQNTILRLVLQGIQLLHSQSIH